MDKEKDTSRDRACVSQRVRPIHFSIKPGKRKSLHVVASAETTNYDATHRACVPTDITDARAPNASKRTRSLARTRGDEKEIEFCFFSTRTSR